MKKIVVLMLALCLAVPAISYAGTATSRWDLTIGGTVKFDMGWVDSKGSGVLTASGLPARNQKSPVTDPNEKYGNQIWGTGETGFNFFVRGPEVWGAKSSAFVLADFTGVWEGGQAGYGSADLLVATMTFDWANTSLMFGEAGSVFGMLPTFPGNQGAWGAVGLFGDKGAAPILNQITLTQRFGKEWSAKFGIMSNTNNVTGVNNFPTGTATADMRANTPGVQGGITYSSGACGKVGPWQLTVGASGGYVRQKQVFTNASGRPDDKNTDGWLADFKFLVPIIPEKNGNKAMALYVDADIWAGQNFDGFNAGWGGAGTGVYDRRTMSQAVTSNNPEYAAATSLGYIAHGAFYFTDQIWFNLFYMRAQLNSSNKFRNTIGGVKNDSQWITSLVYDASPATRFGIQWEHSSAKYAQAPAGFSKTGSQNVYRFNAYYYF